MQLSDDEKISKDIFNPSYIDPSKKKRNLVRVNRHRFEAMEQSLGEVAAMKKLIEENRLEKRNDQVAAMAAMEKRMEELELALKKTSVE